MGNGFLTAAQSLGAGPDPNAKSSKLTKLYNCYTYAEGVEGLGRSHAGSLAAGPELWAPMSPG